MHLQIVSHTRDTFSVLRVAPRGKELRASAKCVCVCTAALIRILKAARVERKFSWKLHAAATAGNLLKGRGRGDSEIGVEVLLSLGDEK